MANVLLLSLDQAITLDRWLVALILILACLIIITGLTLDADGEEQSYMPE